MALRIVTKERMEGFYLIALSGRLDFDKGMGRWGR